MISEDVSFKCTIIFKDGRVSRGENLFLFEIVEWIDSYSPYDIENILISLYVER